MGIDTGVLLVVEGGCESVHGGGIESAPGHFEEDVVFLPNVIAKKAGVFGGEVSETGEGFRIAGPGGGEVFADTRDGFAPDGVLIEHHADGAAFNRDAALGESREERFFFLVVVGAVGEVNEEIERLVNEIGGERSRR